MTHWFRAALAAFVLGTLHIGSASAQPPPTVAELMSEPVTLWDWGMYNAQNALEAADRANKFLVWIGQPNPTHTYGNWSPQFVSIDYDWQKNRLIARAVYGFDANKVPSAAAKTLCRNALRELRQFFRVDPDTGKRWDPVGSGSAFRAWFSHNGYHVKGEPEQRLDGLEQITQVFAVAVLFRDGTGESSDKIVCRGPLLSTEADCSP